MRACALMAKATKAPRVTFAQACIGMCYKHDIKQGLQPKLRAFSVVVKTPVDSRTYSTPFSPHGIFSGDL